MVKITFFRNLVILQNAHFSQFVWYIVENEMLHTWGH